MARIQHLVGRVIPAHPKMAVTALCRVAWGQSSRIPMEVPTCTPAGNVVSRSDGDPKPAPTLIANDAFRNAGKGGGLHCYHQEEQDRAVTCHHLPALNAATLISNRSLSRA